MEVKQAIANDAEVISALNSEVQQLHADLFPELFKPPSAETFPPALVRQLLADPTTYIFIGYLDAQPVGYIYSQIITRFRADMRLEDLFICPVAHLRHHRSQISSGSRTASVRSDHDAA